MITRNATALLAACLLAIALALALGNVHLLIVGLFLLPVVSLGVLFPAPSSPDLERTVEKSTVWVEDTVTIAWEVRVENGMGPVFVCDTLPKDMELLTGSNIRVFWKGFGESRFTNSYTMRCPKRGSYALEPISWETRHPLEFRLPGSGHADCPSTINVLPRLLAIRRIKDVRGLAKTPQPTVDLARIGVATTDFKEIREYTPGDPMRFINWKATAKRSVGDAGQPMLNQFELEGKKAVWLFFDASEYMAVGTTLHSPMEHAIEAASSVGYFYLSRGYSLGAHFSASPNDSLYPDAGKRQFHRLTQELLAVRPSGEGYDLKRAVEVCRAQLFRHTPRCVIFTRLDADASNISGIPLRYKRLLGGVDSLLALSSMRRKRISLWVVAVNGYSYASVGEAEPRMGVTLRQMEIRPLVSTLRRKGVSVLEWDPFHEGFAQTLLRQLHVEGGVA